MERNACWRLCLVFTMHITVILNILDRYLFIVLYYDYEKRELYSSFPTGPASVLPCFCRRV